MPKQYFTCDFHNDKHCGDWYTGKKWWIAVSGGAGLLVGLIRYGFSYPQSLPGLFKDIHDFHVHPTWAPLTFLISAISLCGGATLGPEQGLVSVDVYLLGCVLFVVVCSGVPPLLSRSHLTITLIFRATWVAVWPRT